MELKLFTSHGALAAFALTAAIACSSTTYAYWYPTISYGAEYIQDWDDDDCYPDADLSWLYYTRNTIEYFDAEMSKYGHSKSFLFGNTYAEGTDLAETDRHSYAHDSDYADANPLFAYAGHGGNNSTSFFAPLCIRKSRGFSSSERRSLGTFYSSENRWGENDDKTPGQMRWAIMDTCHSVPPLAHKAWEKTFGQGFEFLMGFRNYSVFLATTDETLEDWAEYVYEDGDAFESAWFDAAEDWFIFAMDPSALSVGNTTSEATNRLRNQAPNYRRRSDTAKVPAHFAWSWTNPFNRVHTYNDTSNTFGD